VKESAIHARDIRVHLKESADKESVDAGGCNKSGRGYTRVDKQQRLVTKKFGFQRKHFRIAKNLAIPGFV
jgi:hypothetical protein